MTIFPYLRKLCPISATFLYYPKQALQSPRKAQVFLITKKKKKKECKGHARINQEGNPKLPLLTEFTSLCPPFRKVMLPQPGAKRQVFSWALLLALAQGLALSRPNLDVFWVPVSHAEQCFHLRGNTGEQGPWPFPQILYNQIFFLGKTRGPGSAYMGPGHVQSRNDVSGACQLESLLHVVTVRETGFICISSI